VYEDVGLTGRSMRPLGLLYATFADGHREVVFGEAVLRSHREGRWVTV